MSADVLTLILAGGEGERLSILSQVRAKPGVPFGGKYRIIDFALSNAVNSGLSDVGILTQYAPRSLIDHIGVGRPWDLDRSRGGVALLQPFIGRGRARDWYQGTADAVLQNLDFIDDRDPELVLVLAGDHVYKMDYRPFIDRHRETGADVTCAVRTVPLSEAHRFGILDVNPEGRVTAFIEKPSDPPSNLVSMGVYVFSWPLLRDLLAPERVDFGRDVLPWMVDQGRRVQAYEFAGYWQDVGTVESYWATSLDLLSDDPGIELNDLGWLIYTRSEERPPARLGPEAVVVRSMISHGCVIDGTVEHSVLSPGVRVGAGATVRDSIVMFDAVIGEGATIDRAIVDKEARIGSGAHRRDRRRPDPERRGAGAPQCRDHAGRQARSRPARRRDRPQLPHRPGSHRARLRHQPAGRVGPHGLRGVGRDMNEEAPPIDRLLDELGLEVVGSAGDRGGAAISRDVVLDGRRRFDLRVTVAWVAGVGCSLWAYYGLEAMEIPKRVYARMLRANFDYAFVKFAMTDDDRPMLMTELPTASLDRDQLGRGLVRLTIVADRLLEETAAAVADRAALPDWSGRTSRNAALLEEYGPEVESVDARLGASTGSTPPTRASLSIPGARVRAARGIRLAIALGLAVGCIGSPGGVHPVAAAEYTLASTATYQVRPDDREISVGVDLEFTNTTPDPAGQFSIFDELRLAIHDAAAEVAASDDEGELEVTVGEASGVTVATIELREGLRYEETVAVELDYQLPDGEGNGVRVGPSLVVFPAWGFGTSSEVRRRGPVRVRGPAWMATR